MDEKASTKRFELLVPNLLVSTPQPEGQQPVAPPPATTLKTKSLPPRGAEIVSIEPARSARASKSLSKPPPKALPKVPIEDHIGRQLKSLYDDVLAQPIPDRFLDLLQKLETRASEKDRT